MLLNVFATNSYYVHTVVEETEEEGKTVFTVCCVASPAWEYTLKVTSKYFRFRY